MNHIVMVFYVPCHHGVGPIFSPGVSGPYRPTFFSDGRIWINEQQKTRTTPFWINVCQMKKFS